MDTPETDLGTLGIYIRENTPAATRERRAEHPRITQTQRHQSPSITPSLAF
ncbi:MAG: hypothetical protein ACI8PG_005417 [Planctomycetota bacterium]|jgi:hypothetical protein